MRKMKSFTEELERLRLLMAQDADDAYSFLEPLLVKPLEKPVVLYAAGKTCERVYKYLRMKGVPVTAVCDKNKQGMFLDSGLKIIPPEELYQNYQDAWVVVCTFNYSVDAISQLCENGICERNILRATYSIDRAYFRTDEFFYTPSLYEAYRYAYDLAYDDTGKGVVLDVLWKDMTGTHRLKKTSKPREGEYFNFDFDESEVFVQAGCFHGETVEAFIKFRDYNPADIIYSFEGDPVNLEIARQNLKKYPNVCLTGKGLWNKEDVLFFSSGRGDRSRIIDFPEDGLSASLQVISLDCFFADKERLPTFIELDIEGAEPEALLGARRILKEAKPKLAICVYHAQDHLYRIPQIIQSINPNYSRFRFEQALDNALTDTILFAD